MERMVVIQNYTLETLEKLEINHCFCSQKKVCEMEVNVN